MTEQVSASYSVLNCLLSKINVTKYKEHNGYSVINNRVSLCIDIYDIKTS